MPAAETFTKYNNSSFADSLIFEAEGLSLLRTQLQQTQNTLLAIPEVYQVDAQHLQLQYICAQAPDQRQMQQLGEGLAQLHSQTPAQQRYGLDHNNYIGLNPQQNVWHWNWGEFFVHYRLELQIQRIKDVSLKTQCLEILQSHQQQLIDFLNRHCSQASLLHGDLWSGNVLFDAQQVWLIDPAIYYGDREIDIAMTEMFGGFSSAFYQGYAAIAPLSDVYPIKKSIYNLYHYLNHYNLFGSSYLSGVEQGMRCIQHLDAHNL